MKNRQGLPTKMLRSDLTTVGKSIAAALLLLMASSHIAHAEQFQSQTRQGFVASAALTDDPQWPEKLAQSGKSTPPFDLAERITEDQPATLLIYFSNPMVRDGIVDVSCTMEMRDARRQVVGRLKPKTCFTRTKAGEPEDVYMFPTMELTAAHVTVSGPLAIEIGITDENRGQELQLSLTIPVDKP